MFLTRGNQINQMVERCLEMQKTLYICFIDYTKASDRVKHDLLFEILSKAGVPDQEINIIKNFTSSRKPQCDMKMKHLKKSQ